MTLGEGLALSSAVFDSPIPGTQCGAERMQNSWVRWSLIAIVAISLSYWLLNIPRQIDEGVVVASRPSVPIAPAHAPEPAASSQMSKQPVIDAQASGPTDPNAVAKKLYDAADWRVFTEWAKQHPESGGLYFASVALNACGEVRQQLKISQVPASELLNDSGTVAQARNAARDKLASRCGTFLDNEITVREPVTLRELGRKRGDPLAIAIGDFEDALYKPSSDGGEIAAAFGKVLSTNSADAILGAALRLTAVSQTVVIDGEPQDREVAMRAWNLAACSFGLDCSVQGMSALMACTFFGACYDSTAEQIRAESVKQFGDAGWQRTQMLAARIAADVKAGNSAAFVKR